jgi:hypothetical protein
MIGHTFLQTSGISLTLPIPLSSPFEPPAIMARRDDFTFWSKSFSSQGMLTKVEAPHHQTRSIDARRKKPTSTPVKTLHSTARNGSSKVITIDTSSSDSDIAGVPNASKKTIPVSRKTTANEPFEVIVIDSSSSDSDVCLISDSVKHKTPICRKPRAKAPSKMIGISTTSSGSKVQGPKDQHEKLLKLLGLLFERQDAEHKICTALKDMGSSLAMTTETIIAANEQPSQKRKRMASE